MSILYAVKTFGRYHFFNSEEKRDEFLNGLVEWERKHVETWEIHLGKVSWNGNSYLLSAAESAGKISAQPYLHQVRV